jgi:peptidoglycan/LPS O-acetylase OafA/YrhL
LGGYRPQLDSLRALAVLTVLFTHFWRYDSILGELGVRLFFVLSGFLLTSILLREGEKAAELRLPRRRLLGDFYVRRILRIWPIYYAALLAALVLGAEGIAQTFVWHALFGSNILFFLEQSWNPWEAAHLWTLAVEEQFYLVLPLVALFLPLRSLRPLFVTLILTAIGFRLVIGVTVSGTLDFYNILPVAQMDALAGGALLALVQRQTGNIRSGKLLAWSLPVAILLDVLCRSEALRVTLVSSAYLLPMIAIVSAASAGYSGVAGALLSNRAIVGLGRISYGVYLYHNFVAAGFDRLASAFGYAPMAAGPVRFMLLSSITIAAAMLSWIAIERPALSLKRYFGRTRDEGDVVPAPA